MRFRKLALLLIPLVAFGTISFAESASACDITYTHCYGVAGSAPAGIDGVYAAVQPACLSASSGNFATDEVWLADANSQYWVEVGYIDNHANINGLYQGWSGFWFDSRPGGGYHGHEFVANPDRTAHTAWILNTAPNTYHIIFGNGYSAYSTNNSMIPTQGMVGSEVTEPGGQSFSFFYNMETHAYGSWSTQLNNPFVITNTPQVVQWYSLYSAMNAGVPCHS